MENYISSALYLRAVCITRNFSETQNPRFLNESGFKSGVGYDASYGLWSFQMGGTKLERFLPKNQQTQRKLLNFEN